MTSYRTATIRGSRELRVADRKFFESTEDLLLAAYEECMVRLEDAVVEVGADHRCAGAGARGAGSMRSWRSWNRIRGWRGWAGW